MSVSLIRSATFIKTVIIKIGFLLTLFNFPFYCFLQLHFLFMLYLRMLGQVVVIELYVFLYKTLELIRLNFVKFS